MSIKERWKGTKEIRFTTDEAIALILPILKNDHRILIAYLFGSRMTKKDHPFSDIDIAIYTSNDFTWQDYYLLYGELTKRLRSDRLDLVWLNTSDSILSFDVIKNGKVIFYSDVDILNDFELKAKKRYYDYVLYLNKHRRYRKEDNIGL